MRVKVFTASTVQEAMNQVKKELGIDAVILHTKRFHKGGFLGYMGKEMVEVTAAVEDSPKLSKVKQQPVSKEVLVPKSVVKNYSQVPIIEVAETKLDDMLQPNSQDAQKNFEDQNRDMLMSNSELEQQQAEKIMQLQRELDTMKIMLDKVVSETAKQQNDNKSLLEILKENEVHDKVSQEIIADIFDEAVLQNRNPVKTREVLCQYFRQSFRQANDIEIVPNKTKVVALIGTTGIGKTTTIAKLAATFVLEKSCSVALVTADTYRISAVEQLRTYSEIIGIPLEIVYSPVELRAALNKHCDKDLILIDTAGRSQHNEFQIRELQELLSVDANIEKHLVLSATTKYKDAVDIIRKFSVCSPDKVLFTKIDETSSIGVVLNLIHQYPIVLSYFTNGQSVPDDISLADSDKLAELLLR